MHAPVIFVHIPKTAGSTLRTIIRKQYGQDRLFLTRAMSASDLNAKRDAVVRSVLEDDVLAMSGHMVYGAHRFVDRSFQYVAMVREPVDRVISDYYYVQRTPTHDFYDPVVTEGYSLEDYVTSQITIYTDNVQTRMLSGIGTDVPIGECTEEHLFQALAHVEDDFAVVGLTEQFDESLLLMQKTLNWSTPLYQSRNKTKRRPSRRDVSAEVRDVIRSHNALDVRLYESVSRRFQRALASYGSGFTRDLRRLRRLNRIYSPAERAYIYFRSTLNDLLGREQW